MELIGPQEVARLLGVSRQRVSQLAKQKGFPKPVAILGAGKIWNADDIREWLAKRERER